MEKLDKEGYKKLNNGFTFVALNYPRTLKYSKPRGSYIKYNSRYEGRLNDREHMQEKGIDYHEACSSILDKCTVWRLITMAQLKKYVHTLSRYKHNFFTHKT
jgi:hypothetical protein